MATLQGNNPHFHFEGNNNRKSPLRRVSDVRQFLVAARPAMAAREFVLMTTFPNRELTDETLTLQDANLLNAVIVQRLQ